MSNLPPQAEPTVDTAGRKIWKAGTLTYTAGGLIVLFALMLWGDFASAMKDRSVGQVFQLLLVKFHASNLVMSLVNAVLGGCVGLVLSPVIAYLSDRHRGRWGRRIPFILWSTPFVSFSLIGVGFSPMLGNWIHHAMGANAPSSDACVLIALTFFWVIYDISSVIGGAVFGGLINDVVPRAVLGRFFGCWRAISLLCGILFNHYLYGSAGEHYLAIYVSMALLFGTGFIFMCLRLKEGEYPPPPPAPPLGVLGVFVAVKGYFTECFTIPYYWLLFISGIFSGSAAGPINGYSLPFAKSLNISEQSYGDYLAITYTCSLLLAYPLGWLVDRMHPLILSIAGMALYTVGMFIGGYFAGDPRYFGYAFIAHGVLSGTYFTVNASLGFRLLPRASFAQFSAAGGIIGTLWGILTAPLIGWELDRLHSDYHYIFFWSAGYGAIACVLYLFVYIQFMKLGGPRGYVAPDKHVTA